MNKRLYRSRSQRLALGVAGGMAEYLGDIDPTLVRVAWIVAACLSAGAALLPYVLMGVIVPERPREGARGDGDPDDAGEQRERGADAWADDDDASGVRRVGRGRIIGGAILIAFGVLFLARHYGLLDGFRWDILWPAVLIIGGLLLIGLGRFRRRRG